MALSLILLGIALVLFVIGTFDLAVRFNPVAAGLACVVLAMIVADVRVW
jgi:uncharacterized membrane protein YqjE